LIAPKKFIVPAQRIFIDDGRREADDPVNVDVVAVRGKAEEIAVSDDEVGFCFRKSISAAIA